VLNKEITIDCIHRIKFALLSELVTFLLIQI